MCFCHMADDRGGTLAIFLSLKLFCPIIKTPAVRRLSCQRDNGPRLGGSRVMPPSRVRPLNGLLGALNWKVNLSYHHTQAEE
jgi:hypothetical protein